MNDDAFPRDKGLEHAENLIARVIDFVTSDKTRLANFLRITGLAPERLQEPELRIFVVGVIDTIAADKELMAALLAEEQINAEDIDMARSRLSFDLSASHGNRTDDDAHDRAIRERVKQLLRALAVLTRERRGELGRHTA